MPNMLSNMVRISSEHIKARAVPTAGEGSFGRRTVNRRTLVGLLGAESGVFGTPPTGDLIAGRQGFAAGRQRGGAAVMRRSRASQAAAGTSFACYGIPCMKRQNTVAGY